MTEKSHAKFYRNLVRAGLCAAVVCHVQIASAGYALPAPPPGWAAGGAAAGPGGSFNFPAAAAANAGTFIDGTVRTNASLSVGGRAVKIPASLRFAANAPRFAAAAIFANPYLRAGAAIAAWVGLTPFIWDAVNRVWTKPDPDAVPEDGLQFGTSISGPWFDTFEDACGSRNGTVKVGSNGGKQCYRMSTPTDPVTHPIFSRPDPNLKCPIGWYSTPAGCVQTQPMKTVPEQEFVEDLTKHPMPRPVPTEVPAPLPIELPEIKPTFSPSGNPVQNPNYNPNAEPSPTNQPWIRPGVNIEPAPTPDEPWRVDTKPINVPQPTPKPEDTPDPNTDPDSKPEEKDPDLCEKNPDILACSKPELDTPEGIIPKATRDVTIEFVDGGDGACPADAYSNVGGQSMLIWDWQATCTYTRNYVKPVILVGAMFMALMIVLGGTKE